MKKLSFLMLLMSVIVLVGTVKTVCATEDTPEARLNKIAVQWKVGVPSEREEYVYAICGGGLLASGGYLLLKGGLISGLLFGGVGTWVGSKYFDLKDKREEKNEAYFDEAQKLLTEFPQLDRTKLTIVAKKMLAKMQKFAEC